MEITREVNGRGRIQFTNTLDLGNEWQVEVTTCPAEGWINLTAVDEQDNVHLPLTIDQVRELRDLLNNVLEYQ